MTKKQKRDEQQQQQQQKDKEDVGEVEDRKKGGGREREGEGKENHQIAYAVARVRTISDLLENYMVIKNSTTLLNVSILEYLSNRNIRLGIKSAGVAGRANRITATYNVSDISVTWEYKIVYVCFLLFFFWSIYYRYRIDDDDDDDGEAKRKHCVIWFMRSSI